ncbi:MAG: hypothetical protein A2849_01015 [Candidatus Taylorbacteria bacterium RIFCSPHIGHO2_01_FULL_51_15]|uniref:Uncharacterized protein n=1 Tax=Candidatus Taylorbacteria bacterium RIFCSPHIGHO2_01_FULL_51_15 TaxID=1802304 RepID=A0A1G2MB13_9BACT|nr:MAG: hypothetical protein A2849_01015 [Candidatus Taylorbacteria bacterium RIFCSPHIGHO2_01_FULL_51_15]
MQKPTGDAEVDASVGQAPLFEAVEEYKRGRQLEPGDRLRLLKVINPTLGLERAVLAVKAFSQGTFTKAVVEAWLFFGNHWFQTLRSWFLMQVRRIRLSTADLLLPERKSHFIVLTRHHVFCA